MFVIWESSIIMVVVMVFDLTIVTVDCDRSLYNVRKRMLWDVNDISNLIISTKAVEEFNCRLQTNYKNRDDYEVAQKPKNPWEESKKLNTIYVSIFATTCYEYFFDVLLEYIGIAKKLIGTSKGHKKKEETIELIQFINDDIYGLPTFLFDIGHREVETIFQMIHLFRSLSYPHQTRLMKASVLREKLQKFITDHSWKLTKPIEAPKTNIKELKNSCQDIKRKLTNISKIFCLKRKPLINSHVFDRYIDHDTTVSSFLFNDYIYETEKCLVYFSTDSKDIESQRKRIVDWNCEEVLESPQYGFDEIKLPVIDSLTGKEDRGSGSTSVGFNESEDEDPANKIDVYSIFNRIFNGAKSTNLTSLIVYLNMNNYYLNLVQYYNIEADVILFSSIKEGKKMLKGVKYLLATRNISEPCDIDYIKRIRSKLILLKMMFNQLFIKLEKKQRLVVDRNGQTIKFLQLVDNVIETLSVPIPMYASMRVIYLQIRIDLANFEDPTIEDFYENKDEIFENYINLPLIHLHSLNSELQ